MPLKDYWPSLPEIDTCITAEAETVDEAILLAVHEPARIGERSAYRDVIEVSTEQRLLADFLTPNLGGSALLLSITGVSGVGKSHMIRWLGAQLRRDERADRMHIITIPKSASLRGVVEAILSPLVGGEYDLIREELRKSVADVSDSAAAIRLGGELKIVLQRQAREIQDQLQGAIGNPELRHALGLKLTHARSLPALIQDPGLERHFIGEVLPRIVHRALHGSRANETGPDDTLGQFTVDDLSGLEREGLAQSARAVDAYYRTVVNALDGRNRAAAVQLLNDALDPAIRGVFNLERAANGLTIEDIVNRVRKQLLNEGKELVLLVEDFAALAGVQESLLKLAIVEEKHAGEEIRAPLRTALAVTDGYLVGRDTILTRAKKEWVVQSHLASDDEVLEHCTNLVGRYLNAARWGSSQLKEQYRESKAKGQSITNWVRCFHAETMTAEDSDRLRAFGETHHRFPLFPFNEAAVAGLCKRHLPKSGGRLEFNPRALINDVLRETLLQQRDEFEVGKFPSPSFKKPNLSENLQLAISDSGLAEDDQARAAVVLYYWGGDPQTQAEAEMLPRAIYDSFGVRPPFEERSELPRPRPTRQPVIDARAREGTSVVEGTAELRALEIFRERLRVWADGGPLTQEDAREIRNEWARVLQKRVEEPELRLKDTLRDARVLASWIYIPGANTGNPPLNDPDRPVLRLTDDSRDPTGRVRKALVALRRRLVSGGWNYEEAEQDFACYAWLLDELASQTAYWLRKTADVKLAYLVPQLYRQSALLGLLPPPGARVVESLAAPCPEHWERELPSAPRPPDLDLYVRAVEDARNKRNVLQDEVIKLASCFQGATGRLAFAIDGHRIAVALSTESSSVRGSAADYPDLRDHLSQLSEVRLSAAVKKATAWVDTMLKSISTEFGAAEIAATLTTLKQAADLAFSSNLLGDSASAEDFLAAVANVNADDLEALQAFALAWQSRTPPVDATAALVALAAVPMKSLQNAGLFIRSAGALLNDGERALSGQVEALRGLDCTGTADKLRQCLAELAEALEELSDDAS